MSDKVKGLESLCREGSTTWGEAKAPTKEEFLEAMEKIRKGNRWEEPPTVVLPKWLYDFYMNEMKKDK